MLTIYYGEDTAKSRKEFIDERSKYPDAVAVSGTSISLTDLLQLLEGGELFATEKHIFIEDFFTKKKPGKETEHVIELLNNNQSAATICIWEGKELSAQQLKQFPRAALKQFKLPQTLFVFLDSIKPANTKQMLSSFHAALADQEISFLFAMLVRQFRLLLALKEPSDETIDEVKRMSPWQKTKLQKQSSLFDKEMLLHLYGSLFETEKGVKTGTLSLPLEQAIDFFLLRL